MASLFVGHAAQKSKLHNLQYDEGGNHMAETENLSFFDLQLLITALVSSSIVCPSSIYGFWWPLWYLQSCPISDTSTHRTHKFRYLDIYIFFPLYVYFRLLIWGHTRLLSSRNTMRGLSRCLNYLLQKQKK